MIVAFLLGGIAGLSTAVGCLCAVVGARLPDPTPPAPPPAEPLACGHLGCLTAADVYAVRQLPEDVQ